MASKTESQDRFWQAMGRGIASMARWIGRGVRRIWVWVVIVVAVLVITLFYLWAKRYILYTADAYVGANWVPISAEVSGYVTQVYVENNQWVEAGEPLFEIDPLPYLYTVNQRKGELDTAIKLRAQLIRQLEVAAADIEVARNQLGISKDRLTRAIPLLEDDFISEEMATDYFYTVKMNEAQLEASVRTYQEVQAELGPPDEPFSQIVTAEAQLDGAEYDLARTIITASVAGWVTNFYLRPGQYVEVGPELFAVVDTSEWWATARFKDVAIGNIKRGAPAKIWVDMYWNQLFDGYVEGMAAGVNRAQASVDAAPSALPYLEQTEFWIRLAQRFPVRIIITDPRAQEALRLGANCRVFIRRKWDEEKQPAIEPPAEYAMAIN